MARRKRRKYPRRVRRLEHAHAVNATKPRWLRQSIVRTIGIVAHIFGRRNRARCLCEHLQAFAVHPRVGRETVRDVEENDFSYRDGLIRSVRHARRRHVALPRDVDAQRVGRRRIDRHRARCIRVDPLDERGRGVMRGARGRRCPREDEQREDENHAAERRRCEQRGRRATDDRHPADPSEHHGHPRSVRVSSAAARTPRGEQEREILRTDGVVSIHI